MQQFLSPSQARKIWVGKHFQQRFRERISAMHDPIEVGHGILWAINNCRDDLVQFLGRDNRPERQNRRYFRACLTNGTTFVAVVDTATNGLITALTEDRLDPPWVR